MSCSSLATTIAHLQPFPGLVCFMLPLYGGVYYHVAVGYTHVICTLALALSISLSLSLSLSLLHTHSTRDLTCTLYKSMHTHNIA